MMRVAALLACLACGTATAASFDCRRAASVAEKMVCADSRLSQLDSHLARYYAVARDELAEGSACLQEDQRQWLRAKRDACATRECLAAAYLDRLAELDALQPGASALRDTELPRRPALVWIVPPAADKVAAPANPRAEPAMVTGNLVDEIATGDGIVLRSARGDRYLLVMLMFLDGKTADRLPLFAREHGAMFTARGHLAPASGAGKRYFEPSRCLFLHRAP